MYRKDFLRSIQSIENQSICRRALAVLENERDVELANYIATRSEAIEKRYRREEAVVRDLVQTTDDVMGWLNKEKETRKGLETEVVLGRLR